MAIDKYAFMMQFLILFKCEKYILKINFKNNMLLK